MGASSEKQSMPSPSPPSQSQSQSQFSAPVLGKDVPYFSLDGRVFEKARVAKVYDGDTVTVIVPLGEHGTPRRIRTRMTGLDACEIRGEGAARGHAARHDLVCALHIAIDPDDRYDEDFFDENPTFIDVFCHEFDKYGRVLVDLAPLGGEPVNAYLVESSMHFEAYDGVGPRPVHAHVPLTVCPHTAHDDDDVVNL